MLLNWFTRQFVKIKRWYRESPLVTTVNARQYKLIHDGASTDDISLIGKITKKYNRQDGPKGDSPHSISISDTLSAGVSNENQSITIFEVQLDEYDEIVGVVCKPNGRFYKRILKDEKK